MPRHRMGQYGGAGATPSGTWAYPLAASWTDRGAIGGGGALAWESGYAWLPSSQGVLDLGSEVRIYYEAGRSPGHDDWSDYSALGMASSPDGITWTRSASNPLATFLPGGQPAGSDILTAEGYFFHAIARNSAGQFNCVFGGATAISSSDVAINVYHQTSNDGVAFTPNAAASAVKIIGWDSTGWAHYTGNSSYNELAASGLWYDPSAQLWHLLYHTRSQAPPNEWTIAHVSGANLRALSGGSSNIFLPTSSNPIEANGDYRGCAIVDRGSGVLDCLIVAVNAAFTVHALCRVPILPDYDWTSPGPPEILYYLQSDFAQTGWQEASFGFFSQAGLALMPWHSSPTNNVRTAPAVRTSDGKLAYSPGNSAHFTSSSSQRISKTTALTGITNSKQVSFACAFRATTVHGGTLFKIVGGSGGLAVYCNSNNTLGIVAWNSAGTVIIDTGTIASAYTSATWYWLGVSIDLAAGYTAGLRWYLNNTDVKPSTQGANIFTNDTINFTGTATILVGADSTGGASPYNGDITNVTFEEGLFVDWASTPIRRRCMTAANELQHPEVDGRRWFGRTPIIHLNGDQTSILTNRGSGGGTFTFGGTGSLTAGSAPTGHP